MTGYHPQVLNSQEMTKRLPASLQREPRRRLSQATTADAAVLVIFDLVSSQPRLLFTKRTQQVSTLKGEISFPGGRRDPADADLLATALRETEEEIGLSRDNIEIVGRFHDYLSRAQWRVTPFFAFLTQDFEPAPNPKEVERVLQVPWAFFVNTKPRRETRQWQGRTGPVYFWHYQNVIWGLTDAIIKDMLDLLSFPGPAGVENTQADRPIAR